MTALVMWTGLAKRRIGRLSATKDAGKRVSAMRDEDER